MRICVSLKPIKMSKIHQRVLSLWLNCILILIWEHLYIFAHIFHLSSYHLKGTIWQPEKGVTFLKSKIRWHQSSLGASKTYWFKWFPNYQQNYCQIPSALIIIHVSIEVHLKLLIEVRGQIHISCRRFSVKMAEEKVQTKDAETSEENLW